MYPRVGSTSLARAFAIPHPSDPGRMEGRAVRAELDCLRPRPIDLEGLLGYPPPSIRYIKHFWSWDLSRRAKIADELLVRQFGPMGYLVGFLRAVTKGLPSGLTVNSLTISRGWFGFFELDFTLTDSRGALVARSAGQFQNGVWTQGMIEVEPLYRRSGYGRQLLLNLVQWLREIGSAGQFRFRVMWIGRIAWASLDEVHVEAQVLEILRGKIAHFNDRYRLGIDPAVIGNIRSLREVRGVRIEGPIPPEILRIVSDLYWNLGEPLDEKALLGRARNLGDLVLLLTPYDAWINLRTN